MNIMYFCNNTYTSFLWTDRIDFIYIYQPYTHTFWMGVFHFIFTFSNMLDHNKKLNTWPLVVVFIFCAIKRAIKKTGNQFWCYEIFALIKRYTSKKCYETIRRKKKLYESKRENITTRDSARYILLLSFNWYNQKINNKFDIQSKKIIHQ